LKQSPLGFDCNADKACRTIRLPRSRRSAFELTAQARAARPASSDQIRVEPPDDAVPEVAGEAGAQVAEGAKVVVLGE
jgi:hypothetical protein